MSMSKEHVKILSQKIRQKNFHQSNILKCYFETLNNTTKNTKINQELIIFNQWIAA